MRESVPRLSRDVLLQGLGVGVVGAALGGYVLLAAALPGRLIPLLLAAVFCPIAALLVGDLRRVLLAAVLLDTALQVDVHLGYRAEFGQLGAIGGLNVSPTTFALVPLYCLWAGRLLVDAAPGWSPLLRSSGLPALYVAFVALSATQAPDPELAGFGLWLLIQLFLVYLYVAGTVRSRRDVLFTLTVLLVGLALESLVIVGVRLSGQGFGFIGMEGRIESFGPERGGLERIVGTSGSANHTAAFISLLLAPALSLLLAGPAVRHGALATLSFGLGVVAIVLTLSRGGWIAMATSLATLVLAAWRRGRLPLWAPFLLGAVVLALLLAFQDALAQRLLADDRGAARSRIPLMMLALNMIADHPLLGVGVNNFAVVLPDYAGPELAHEWLYTVHNVFLLIWAESGLGALLAFLLFLVVVIRRGWRLGASRDRLIAPLALGCTAAIVGHAAHMQVDVLSGRVPGQLFWVLAGLLTAMRTIEAERA